MSFVQNRDARQTYPQETIAEKFVCRQEEIKEGAQVWTRTSGQGPFVIIGPAEVPVGFTWGRLKTFRWKDGGSSVRGWWCRNNRGDVALPHYDLTTTPPKKRNLFFKVLSFSILFLVAGAFSYLNSGHLTAFFGGLVLGPILQITRFLSPMERLLNFFFSD